VGGGDWETEFDNGNFKGIDESMSSNTEIAKTAYLDVPRAAAVVEN